MLHDLRLRDLKGFLIGHRNPQLVFSTPLGTKIAAQFDARINNLRSLSQLPVTTTMMSNLWNQSWAEASNTWAVGIPTDAETKDPGVLTVEAIRENFAAMQIVVKGKAISLMREKLAADTLPANFNMNTPPPFILLQSAQDKVDLLMGLSVNGHQSGLQFLSALCIQAWAVFEGMVEDLHTDATLTYPECFLPEVLTGKKYHFRKLEELPKSYNRAFGANPLITSEVENSDVRALGLLRHLLVHKGGKVDQKHLDERAKPPQVNQLDSFGLDSTVEVTGSLVCSLVNPVIAHGYRLLKLVDAWLEDHKPK